MAARKRKKTAHRKASIKKASCVSKKRKTAHRRKKSLLDKILDF